jgi:heptaprenyl diphosphate synthase
MINDKRLLDGSKTIAKREDDEREKLVSQTRRLLRERGSKTYGLVRSLMLENERNIQCKEVREALHYFLDEYWTDLARPTLMRLSCEAVGSNCQKITSITIPMMLIAGGIDIHDDIIDKSKIKNGRPTVFGKFGGDVALLIGDAFIFKGLTALDHALKDVARQKARMVLEILNHAFFELGDAEALELGLRGKIEAAPRVYLRIINKKAADVEAYTYVSALVGNGTEKEITALKKYGRILGMLAIIRDDLIDMMDEEELMHRLEMEVAPLPLVYAVQNPKARTSINMILAKKTKTVKDIKRIIEISTENRGLIHTEKKINQLITEGLLSLGAIKNKKKQLQALIRSMKVI